MITKHRDAPVDTVTLATQRKRSINGRKKGMKFEYDVRDELRVLSPESWNPEKQKLFRDKLLEAFQAAKRNNEASAGHDTNDLATDLTKIDPNTIPVLVSFPLQVECKCQKNVNYRDAYEQAADSLKRTGLNKRIVLITKESFRSTHPNFTGRPMVTVAFDDFIDLLINGNLFPTEKKVWKDQIHKRVKDNSQQPKIESQKS